MSKRRSGNFKRVILAVVVVVALSSFLSVVLVIRVADTLDIDFEPIAFESTSWIGSQSDFSHKSLRLLMVDDLLAKHELVGMSREEIVALIGEPNDTEYLQEYEMVYHLGQERHPLGMDNEWLAIDLDECSTATFVVILSD